MGMSVRLRFVAFVLFSGVCMAQLDVPFFMPRLATNLMGEGRPEAGSLESMDALSQYPCYGNACERLNREQRDGWDGVIALLIPPVSQNSFLGVLTNVRIDSSGIRDCVDRSGILANVRAVN